MTMFTASRPEEADSIEARGELQGDAEHHDVDDVLEAEDEAAVAAQRSRCPRRSSPTACPAGR